jgi:thioredoxin reductase (NADPH)
MVKRRETIMVYDAAIIGTGPAGVSAALNLKIHEKNFIWLGSSTLSDKITKAERISNYPGLSQVSGQELNEAFRAQIAEMGIEITEQMVNSILPFGGHYALMAGSEFYEAQTLILTTGVANVGTIPGESELVGKGVSYCATCDGSLYRGRTIAVLCNAARFEHEVAYLAGMAGQVYYFPTYQGAAVTGENLTLMTDRIVAVLGDQRLQGVKLRSGETLPVDGLFCLRDAVALSTLLPKLATEDGHIVVDRTMATNLPGVYAAGDCTGRPYQYTKAVGEGNVAAHSVIAYLAESTPKN